MPLSPMKLRKLQATSGILQVVSSSGMIILWSIFSFNLIAHNNSFWLWVTGPLLIISVVALIVSISFLILVKKRGLDRKQA